MFAHTVHSAIFCEYNFYLTDQKGLGLFTPACCSVANYDVQFILAYSQKSGDNFWSQIRIVLGIKETLLKTYNKFSMCECVQIVIPSELFNLQN